MWEETAVVRADRESDKAAMTASGCRAGGASGSAFPLVRGLVVVPSPTMVMVSLREMKKRMWMEMNIIIKGLLYIFIYVHTTSAMPHQIYKGHRSCMDLSGTT
jgi:hypothetical protein